MASGTPTNGGVWGLARRQHGVVSRAQLLEAGLSRHAIAHRLKVGRLHRVRRGVFTIGRPELTRHGIWMAAVLSCPAGSVLSHESAAALLGIEDRERTITLSGPHGTATRQRDIRLHCREFVPGDRGELDRIPLTSPVRTLIDLATIGSEDRLEAAVNAADKLDLVDPETLRSELERRAGRPGVPLLRRLLDARTFRLSDSGLERAFLRIVRGGGLSIPETGAFVNGFKVDFYWRDIGLVVETDSLRYHRTAREQARDRLRDQTHAAAGLTTLRFTHAQLRDEPDAVLSLLAAVAARLASVDR